MFGSVELLNGSVLDSEVWALGHRDPPPRSLLSRCVFRGLWVDTTWGLCNTDQ